MKTAIIVSCIVSSIAVALGAIDSAGALTLEKGFKSPPDAAKPQTWYHLMNGNVTKEGVTRDFEELAKAGIGGVQIFDVGCDIPPGDVKFGSPEWFDLLRHAHNEAKRLGLKLGIHNCSGWSCSGGPWVTPADAMKVTMHAETAVAGPSRFTRKLGRIKKDNGFYADIAVLAYPTIKKGATLSNAAEKTGRIRKGAGQSFVRDTKEFPAEMVIAKDKIIDITSKMAKDGTLTWDIPAGKWTIFRLGYICNGRRNRLPSKDGDGLEVDKFSAAAFDRHFDAYMGRLCRELGMRAGDVHETGLCNIHVDSWEVGCQNWTHGLEKIFEKRVGYSMIPYLPILAGYVVGSVEESERFCEDFRRLLSDLLAENYAGQFAKRCHEYGLVMTAEPYGPSNADDMQYGEVVDVPMSCFWMDGTCGPGKFPCFDNSHYAASLAHVWGRRYVADEAFTSGPPNGGRWLETPFSIKWQNDRAFAKGCNMIVYHRFTHQPWPHDRYLPGMTMGRWGMHLDRTQTWWPLAGGWFRYQARCQWMLQEGMFCADALFWSGDAAPKHGWPKVALPNGYDYDVCATKVVELLKERNGKVVVPGGVEYEMLVLPDTDTMSEKMVKRIGELVEQGARIVAPMRPTRTPGLRGGKVAWPNGVMECSAAEAVKRLGIAPDFTCDVQDAAWIHRRDGSADWYFVSCGNTTNVTFEASFRIVGKVPEIWDAETGEIRDTKKWRVEGGRTVVTLDFPPSGSAFVVFRREGDREGREGREGLDSRDHREGLDGRDHRDLRDLRDSRDNRDMMGITGTWQVSFPVDWYTGGKEVKSFDWSALKDWTTDSDPDVKYFSGTATYHKRFALTPPPAGRQPRDRRIILDLGEVKDFAEVKVNGKSYPPLWRPPFRIDITDVSGILDIEIRVTNLWPNRLIGDETLYPADCEWTLRWHGWQKLNEPGIKEIPQWVKDGKPSPTGRHTFTTWKHWTKDDVLLPSGLLGPVKLLGVSSPPESKGTTNAFDDALVATVAKTWKSPNGGTLPYRLHVPAKPEPGRLYPLVVHMHGAGSWGTNNIDQIRTGGADFISWAKRHGEEYVFIAPQTPKRRKWVDTPWENKKSTMKETPTPSLRMAMEIIDDAVARYPVDRDRIYVMGISMGGYAAWELLQRRPELFAAGLPCCGGGDEAQATRLTNVAIWAFHGSADKGVPVCRSRNMVAAIKAAGGKKILYREYKGRGHNVWTPTFSDDKVFDWLFSQRR